MTPNQAHDLILHRGLFATLDAPIEAHAVHVKNGVFTAWAVPPM